MEEKFPHLTHPPRPAKSREDEIYHKFIRLEDALHEGNEAALYEALAECLNEPLCEGDQQFLGHKPVTLPRWALEAALNRVARYMLDAATTGTGRAAKWSSRYKQDMVDFDRYECVLEHREHGVTWEDVYERVTETLEDTRSAGRPDTIRGSYMRVNKRMKTEPYRYRIFRYVKVQGLG